MGDKRVFGPAGWKTFFGDQFHLVNISEIPWTEDELRDPGIAQEHFLFLGLENLEGMPLGGARVNPGQPKFPSFLQLFVNQVQTFTGGNGRFRWYLMPIGVVKYSWNRTYDAQAGMLPEAYEIPTLTERLTGNMLFHLLNGKYLDVQTHKARTRTQSEGDKYTPILRHSIGFPHDEEVYVVEQLSERAMPDVGIAASRKITS